MFYWHFNKAELKIHLLTQREVDKLLKVYSEPVTFWKLLTAKEKQRFAVNSRKTRSTCSVT